MTNCNAVNQAGFRFDNSYEKLPNHFYTKLLPTKVCEPQLKILNESLAVALGLDVAALRSESAVEMFAGNFIPKGAEPLAQAYAGHQFGHFNMLGDGRAILLGEHMTPDGKRVDIQLKGSGRTPYSRSGDGRATLGPMLREYIISEAMYGLGISTTRSLAVVTTGEVVLREKKLRGAILTRVAASHIRVGTFQYVSEWGTKEELQQLADYTIARHYSNLAGADNRYLDFLRAVMKRQAQLISKWQCVGFIHGVMNTDNMAISGETIDYGPCAFMDTYDPATVFSSIDYQGRYAYGNQPHYAGWDIARFAETLIPLIHENREEAIRLLQNEIEQFMGMYQEAWQHEMCKKFGVFSYQDKDEGLITDFLQLMYETKSDFTNTFRSLTLEKFDEMEIFQTEVFIHWKERWHKRLAEQSQTKEEVIALMKASNPSIIPRNHRVEEAIEAAVEKEDYEVMNHLLRVLSCPYAYTKEQEIYTALPTPSHHCYRTFCGT